MKTNYLLGAFLFFLSTICFTACDDNFQEDDDLMIWDFTPIILFMTVQDAEGNDLLNPETNGTIADQAIKAIYKGETYEKDAKVVTKAYLAYFTGLQTQKNNKGVYYLTFGEFNGDDTFKNEEVTIEWHDGTTDVIRFSSKLSWKSRKEPVFDREFLLNGVKQEYSLFELVKKPALSAE